MFFAPCSVGLLPAYLAHFNTHGKGEDSHSTGRQFPPWFRSVARALGGIGAVVFLMGAIPLFYMAVSGLRIMLPGYQSIVPLAQLGTGSYMPPVVFVTAGTLVLLQGLLLVTNGSGLSFGIMTSLGIVSTYLLIGLPVVLVGQWLKPYLLHLQLLAGPLIIALGMFYYTGWSLSKTVRLPKRTDNTISASFGFGVLYGIGSLACNLPLFLGVILSVFATGGFVDGIAVFIAFAGGMSTLMIGVTMLTAATGSSISVGQYSQPIKKIGSIAFVGLGLYVTWYSLVSFGYL